MDYNFLVAHFGGGIDPRRSEMAREQTLQTYLHYFRTNYSGNRAPLHIGHHFTGFVGGAYNAALKTFARAVCGLPEVRCVDLCEARRFHGPAKRRNPRRLSQGRVRARGHPGAQPG